MKKNTKNHLAIIIVFVTIIIDIGLVEFATAGLSHYKPGGLGIKNATALPPGTYYLGYYQYSTFGIHSDESENKDNILKL